LPENRHLRRGIALAYLAVGALAAWLFVKFALAWLLPFIAAFFISRATEPLVRFLTSKLRLGRAAASALCAALVFAGAIALVTVAVGRIVAELTALARQLPALLLSLRELIASAPPEFAGYINAAFGSLTSVSTELISRLASVVSGSPKILLFVFACAVGTFFISSGYEDFRDFLLRQIPERRHAALRDFKREARRTFGKWLRAQAMLSGITFGELAVVFGILRIDFAVLLALLVALIDMLPVLGVGTVLVPWGALELIKGRAPRAILLFASFAVILLVRSVLEPKLVGGQLGLPPLAALIAMYVGFCAAGVSGMVLFPIGLIMIKHLNDRGYIRLWK
jgi:sporulation integral membrane protein YtvI